MTVPVMIHLRGETFLKLEAIARRKHMRMADMIAAGLDRSVQPTPTPAPAKPRTSRRSFRYLTAAEWNEIDRLRTQGYRVRNLATQFGITPQAIYSRDAKKRRDAATPEHLHDQSEASTR